MKASVKKEQKTFEKLTVPLKRMIKFVNPKDLNHIEKWSVKRVKTLYAKILSDNVWTKPLCIDKTYLLIMDGQHRHEVALLMKLKQVPVIFFDYQDPNFRVWSAKGKIDVTGTSIIENYLKGKIYPYKTVDHEWHCKIPSCKIPLAELRLET